LQWAQSALASLRRQYKAAIASTRLQAAAFYNPKFFPMVTLCVSSLLATKANMRMLHFMFSLSKLPAAQATLLTTVIFRLAQVLLSIVRCCLFWDPCIENSCMVSGAQLQIF